MTTTMLAEREAMEQALSLAARIAFDPPDQTSVQEMTELAVLLQLAPDSPPPSRPIMVMRNQWRIWIPYRQSASTGKPLLWQKTFDCRMRPDLRAPTPLPQGIALVTVRDVTDLHVDGVAMLRRALLRELSRRVHLLGDRDLIERWRSVTAGAVAVLAVHAL